MKLYMEMRIQCENPECKTWAAATVCITPSTSTNWAHATRFHITELPPNWVEYILTNHDTLYLFCCTEHVPESWHSGMRFVRRSEAATQ